MSKPSRNGGNKLMVCGGMGKTCRLREKTELGVPRNIRVVSIGKS